MSDAADRRNPHAAGPLATTPPPATSVRAARVIALLSDVMASTRLEAAARDAGCTLQTVARFDLVVTSIVAAAVVVLDLTDPVFPFAETFSQIRTRAPEACVIAFYPHVRDDLGQLARSAGCDFVLPRSRFFADPAAVLRAGLAMSRTPTGEPEEPHGGIQ